jgi:ribose transport system substrate-binding protein
MRVTTKRTGILVGALLLSLVLVFSLSANGSQEEKDDAVTVGFLVHDLGNPFWAMQAKGATDMAAELGVELIVIDAQVNAAKEVSTWEDWISRGLDGIMISCVDEMASKEYCKKAQAAGIKVMAAVHPLPGADGSLSNDEYHYGYIAGEAAGKFIAEKLGGKAKFALLAADCTAFVIPRTDGIRDGILSQAPNAQLVSRQDAYQTDKGMMVIESVLQAHPDLKVVGCLNDDGALGAYEALTAAGVNPKEICITGTDGVQQALVKIKEGGMYRASVSMAPYESGRQEMDILYKLITGQSCEPHQKIQNELITMDNVDKFLN